MRVLKGFCFFILFPFWVGASSYLQPTETPVLKHLRSIEPTERSSGMQGVDCIYVINLEERPEKWERVQKEFSSRGMHPQRVSAINGWRLSEEILKEIAGPYPVRLKKGEYGCLLSHLSVMRDAFKRGFDVIWLCEDDLEFSQEYCKISQLLKKLDRLDPEWDLFFTDRHPRCTYQYTIQEMPSKVYLPRPDQKLEPPDFYQQVESVADDILKIRQRFGMYSVLISKRGIQKIYDYFSHVHLFSPFDVDVHYIPGIREYAAAKPLVFHKLKTYLTPTTLADEEISDTEKPLIAPEETEKRAHLLFEEAQAFQEAKKREKALDCYQRRAALEGDRKEVFWSLYQIGNLEQELGKDPKLFLQSYYKAFHSFPERSEPLYRIALHCRLSKQYLLGHMIATYALEIPKPQETAYVETWMYDWGLLMEGSLCAYYLKEYAECKLLSDRILAQTCIPLHIRQQVFDSLLWVYSKLNPPLQGETKDDASSKITVITTTNPIPSIPDTRFLYHAQASLFRIPAFARCKKIIVFDGLQPAFEKRAEDYEKYKQKVIELAKTDPYFSNTELIFCDKWVHLAGAMKEAIKHVATPYLFVHQHDFVLQKDFDLEAILATMDANPHVKHVRLAKFPTNMYAAQWEFDAPVDQVIEGPAFVPLSRTGGWSDNDHITRLDYYKDFVLSRCGHGPMEWSLHPALKNAMLQQGWKGHLPFGTYLLGNPADGGYIFHADGRGIWSK